MQKMILRSYQSDAQAAIFKEWEEHSSTLLVLPTGTGKTVVFAFVISQIQPGRTLVIAHREELIFQARQKIEHITGLGCEIEMADQSAETDLFKRCQVVVSTIQTQTSGNADWCRMHRFKPTDFSLLIIDEAHHACADSYKKLIDYYRQNPRLKVLGVTATPDRADEAALGQTDGYLVN